MRSYWTPDEDAKLKELISKGLALPDIGRVLGRTADAVDARARRLNARHVMADIPVFVDEEEAAEAEEAAVACGDANVLDDDEPPPTDPRPAILSPLPPRDSVPEDDEPEEEDPRLHPFIAPYIDAGSELERTMWLPDIHFPYHDKKSMRAVLEAGRNFRPHRLVLIGDVFDFYQVSDHDRDPRRSTSLESDVTEGNAFLDELIQWLQPQQVVLTWGNHEYRLERYLMRKAPELLPFVSVDDLFQMKERNWLAVPYRRHIKIGKLYASHEVGHAGKYASYASQESTGHSIVFGHSHRLSMHYTGNIIGERHVAVNLGWLGDIWSADYAHESKKRTWQHGFGLSWAEPSGYFGCTIVPVVDNRVIGSPWLSPHITK